ncbi:blood vessel epicardial substance-like [Daphnia pulex]|uniref:blood vessel epicardial substance-like n=1 Tax=Daphnia pulex TaxID=6669 RepID=UPI001EE13643|nr:blood vessel epicardial substance-like [Daphnia pulex]
MNQMSGGCEKKASFKYSEGERKKGMDELTKPHVVPRSLPHWVFSCANAERKTRPDSSNSIGDGSAAAAAEEEKSDVFNHELLLPGDSTGSRGNRSEDEASGDQDLFQLDRLNNSTVDGINATQQQPADYDWSAVWPYFNTGCLEWLPINHIYFQLANSFLFLSYLAPAGLYGLIYLRLMLAIGSAFFAIWGWFILCAFDTFLWNAFFLLINVVHVIYLLCSLKPPKFDKQVEEHSQWIMVYKTIFQPLKVSKQQFQKVVNCMKLIKPLKRGEHFAVEKVTRVETLSLLLSGSMLVIENGKTLHVLHPMQFLDSPEWFGVSSDDFFQVSIRACEESRVLLWHRDKLKLILLTDPFLQAVFDHILGRDVVRKLTQMKEKIASPTSGGGSPFRSSNLINNGSFIENEKSLTLPAGSSKNSMHEHGLKVVPPEQMSLLDESVQSKKMRNKSGSTSPALNTRKFIGSPASINSPTGRYDYSIVQHLDSTDI